MLLRTSHWNGSSTDESASLTSDSVTSHSANAGPPWAATAARAIADGRCGIRLVVTGIDVLVAAEPVAVEISGAEYREEIIPRGTGGGGTGKAFARPADSTESRRGEFSSTVASEALPSRATDLLCCTL
jgi:hypothetical protein